MDYDVYSDYGDEDIYDYMDNDYYLEDSRATNYSLRDLWKDCLLPTLSDGFHGIFPILICSLLIRFTSSLGFLPPSALHLTAGLTGLYCLHDFFAIDSIYVVILAVIGYVSIVFSHKVFGKHTGLICSTICFLYIISCETFIVGKVSWHRIRGSQMVLAMKLISLSFDIDNGELSLPSPDECFGYLFCAATVIFGPWVNFNCYLRILRQGNKALLWTISIMQSCFLAFMYLTISTCWTSWLFQSARWKWFGAYRDALSFRSSHYFVSYVSEALAITAGISASSGSWGLPVSHPKHIEVPRSLVEVVTNWNLPVHFWLKTYVFKTAKPLGNFVAVLLTYMASSLLHGLNFQLSAVLLSLGFYTYIEYVVRQKLALAFDACILAKRCKKDCDHEHKHNNTYVIATNLAFGFLSVFHLAYLGVMFNSAASVQEQGYSMQHTLKTWSELDFASHWVSLATYIFYVLI